jgi:cytohesin
MITRISSILIGLALVAACHTQRPGGEALGLEPLHEAARSGDLDRARALLDSGADVETRDAYERTALHWAAIRGEVEIAELLLDRGAVIDARAWYDMQPLHWASLTGREAVVRLLLARGADPNAVSFYGLRPLHLAKTAEVVRLLLASGADIHARDVRGMTPMHLSRTQEVAQALIDEGTDLGVKARDGRRPFDMSMAANEGPERVIIHPAASVARLRRDTATFGMAVMNLSEAPIRDVRIVATSPAARVHVEPATPQTLHPAQLVTFTLHLEREPDAEPGKHEIVVTMSEGNQQLLDFDQELDTRREETPEDRGLVKVAEIQLSPPLSTWQYLAFASPVVLLLGAWALRRWLVRGRRA